MKKDFKFVSVANTSAIARFPAFMATFRDAASGEEKSFDHITIGTFQQFGSSEISRTELDKADAALNEAKIRAGVAAPGSGEPALAK